MNRRLYFLIILYLFKYLNEGNILNFNLKVLNDEEKVLKNFFFKLKLKINDNLTFYKTLKTNYTSFYNILKHIKKNRRVPFSKHVVKNTHFFYSYKFKDRLYDEKIIQKYFNFYYKYYVIPIKPNLNYKNSNYIDFIINRRNKASVLFLFVLKKKFYKILNLIINSGFMCLKPLIVGDWTSEKFIISPRLLSKYINYLNNNTHYNYVIIFNPKSKLKNLRRVLDLNLPVISIADDTVNSAWIDYPIDIHLVDEFSIFFFYSLFINLYCIGLSIKKKYNTAVYYEFLKFNFLKEQVIKNYKNASASSVFLYWQRVLI